MASSVWKSAFEAVHSLGSFTVLNALLDEGTGSEYDTETQAFKTIDATFDWDGEFLTPLFVAVLLRLDDHIPRLLALGADPNLQCLHQGLLCGPLHAAALCNDYGVLRGLLSDESCAVNARAEASSLGARQSFGLSECTPLQAMVRSDIFSEQVYRLLLRHGSRLALTCRETVGKGEEISGLALPSRFRNHEATETRLDSVIGEELRHLIRTSSTADELNKLLEAGAAVKRQNGSTAYRFVTDVDFDLGDGDTALLYSARVGHHSTLRLLLYAGADPLRTTPTTFIYAEDGSGKTMTLQANALHIAVLRGERCLMQELVSFGVASDTLCKGSSTGVEGDAIVAVPAAFACAEQWEWTNVTSMHLAVLNGDHGIVALLLKLGASLEAIATRRRSSAASDDLEAMTPLRLAAHLDALHCASTLLDLGARVDELTRAVALRSARLREMFGGPPVVGIEDWISAILTGESALQRIIDCRTDLSRPLAWPTNAAELLAKHRLASVELIGRLESALTPAPTELRDVRPVHLACMLQQSWALGMLADAGAPVCTNALLPCSEAPSGVVEIPDVPGSVPYDAAWLCVRIGGLTMLELLASEPRFGIDLRRELPLVPDLTPSFYPGPAATLDGSAGVATEVDGGRGVLPTWAWQRLSALELALLHRRVDVAVLLVRLGADLMHTTDHVAIQTPSHFLVLDGCFRGLTPLHVCALLPDDCGLAAAAALLREAEVDRREVVPGEHKRPYRQTLLTAGCTQAWASVGSTNRPEIEPWLWRNLTPLHLAIVAKNYGVASALIEASTSQSLEAVCYGRETGNPEDDIQRSYSALLLAFERNLKDLHRKIAKKFPAC